MGTFLISSINIALPSIEKTFGLNAIMLNWVVTSFLLQQQPCFCFLQDSWGDISGVVRLYKAGLIIFTLSSLLCRLLRRVAGLLQPVTSGYWRCIYQYRKTVILVGSFPPQNRGSVLGISVSSVYLGLSFGPFVEDYSLNKLAGAPFSWQQPLSDSFQRSYRFFI